MLLRRLAVASASTGAATVLFNRTSLCDDAVDPVQRRNSDPPPPDDETARKLVQRWTEQEERPGYLPPNGNWPAERPTKSDIPFLRAAFDKCGGKDHLREGPRTRECTEVSFKLAVALLGGTLYGHVSDDDDQTSEAETSEGADLMRCVADAGSIDGLCGFAYLLHNGDFVKEDVPRAAKYHEQAATAGYAQSMHELGTMFYLGDGLPENYENAAHWYRQAAERGFSGSMYMLGELLLAGEGTKKDVPSAIGWFAAAGELGHRGARSRIVSAIGDGPGRYYDVAALRVSDWAAVLLG